MAAIRRAGEAQGKGREVSPTPLTDFRGYYGVAIGLTHEEDGLILIAKDRKTLAKHCKRLFLFPKLEKGSSHKVAVIRLAVKP